MLLKKWIRKILLREKADSASYINWMRSKGATVGNDVTVYVPTKTQIDMTCPWLLTIGDHVRITQGVIILTHDYSWSVLKQLPDHKGIILGAQSPVSIGNNVFIGMNTIITRGVTVGDNVVIGAGSVVTKDCESNSVYAGNPAKKIMTIDEYFQKRYDRQFAEAKEMARIYRKKFGRNPPKEVFSEYFLMIFCSFEEGAENPVFSAQMATGEGYDDTLMYMQKHKPMFESYEAFLTVCFDEKER